jgi:hypothetical protein
VNTDTKEDTVKFIDEYIKAELPVRDNFPNMTNGEFSSYLNLVVKQMKHDCSHAANGCKSKKTDFCSISFSKFLRLDFFLFSATSFSSSSFFNFSNSLPLSLFF